MASMRSAAAFYLSVFAFAALACTVRPAISSPLLAPELPAFDSRDVTLPSPEISTTRLDVIAGNTDAKGDAPVAAQVSPRRMLADFALKLRNIAYVRGGRELTTGFDCSGFVRFVFQQSLGFELPSNSTSQYAEGNLVDKDALRMGDLVFFRTHGKRVSHVGIYLDNGLFIHSPSRGKRVRIDHLDGKYWAKRYAGAKRPDALT
jgi:cell wall-associated NlpC family hydrolase